MIPQTIRIATRKSDLALAQCGLVQQRLQALHPGFSFELVHISTTGDKNQGAQGPIARDKRDWILELEEALLAGHAELAIHSGKDVPYDIAEGTALLPVLPRGNPFDVLVVADSLRSSVQSFAELPQGATVGTASLRRKAQLLYLRPDLKIAELRGNVPTRLRKVNERDDIDAIVIAAAGIERLSIDNVNPYQFDSAELLPAINQGTLVAQYRKDNAPVAKLLSALVDPDTESAWNAERACVEVLQADCNSAVCIYAQNLGDEVQFSCRALSHDGARIIEENATAPKDAAQQLGVDVASRMLERGARELFC